MKRRGGVGEVLGFGGERNCGGKKTAKVVLIEEEEDLSCEARRPKVYVTLIFASERLQAEVPLAGQKSLRGEWQL